MGLDLTFIPVESIDRDHGYGHTLLDSRPGGDVVQEIFAVEKKSGIPAPERFHSYVSRDGGGEPHYGEVRETPYGERLKMVRIGELLRAIDGVDLSEESPRFKGAIAYLSLLDYQDYVALYWH